MGWHEVYTAINKLESRVSDVCEFAAMRWEFLPMKKPRDIAEDVEGDGQIIWCFISKGRTDRKRPALKIYGQPADTRPEPMGYSSKARHDLSQA